MTKHEREKEAKIWSLGGSAVPPIVVHGWVHSCMCVGVCVRDTVNSVCGVMLEYVCSAAICASYVCNLVHRFAVLGDKT